LRSPKLVSFFVCNRDTCFACYSRPPVTVMGCPNTLLFFVLPTPKRRPPWEERCLLPISATDLLSRAPLETTNSRALSLRFRNLRFRRLPFQQHACTDFGAEPSTKAPDSRERHLRPRVATRWCRMSQPRPWVIRPPFGGPTATPWLPARDIIRLGAGRKTWSLTLPVALASSCRLSSAGGGKNQGPFPPRHTIAATFQTRSAFRRWIPFAPPFCLR
jgi:hypothetical protein